MGTLLQIKFCYCKIPTQQHENFGKGKVSESCGDGLDGWVGVVDQNIGYHLPTVINQVSI